MGELEVFKETNKHETILSDTYDEVNILPNIFIEPMTVYYSSRII